MTSEKINVEIVSRYDDRDARDAIDDAEKIDDADPSLDVTAEATDATRTLTQLIEDTDKLDSESATIVLAIRGAEIQQQIESILIDLGKLDTTTAMADIKIAELGTLKGDLDQVETKLKAIDETNFDALNTSAGTTRTRLGEVHGEADQTKSVMANMVGNATQDLGALGGVAGTAGQAIGQLGEYATEGNISLGQLATLAGPMVGLGVALAGVQYVMQGIAKEKAFDADQVEAYAKAIDEVGAGTDAVAQHLRDVEAFEFTADSGFLGFGTTVKDVTDLLDRYGITVGELSQVIAGTDAQTSAWVQTLVASDGSLDEQLKIVQAVKEAQDNYRTALERSATAHDVYKSSADDINHALNEQRSSTGTAAANWSILLRELERGGELSDNAVNSWDNLKTELGLTETQMAELAAQKLDEKLEADAAAAQALHEQLQETNNALIQAGLEMDVAAGRAEAMTTALDELNEASGLEEFSEISSVVDPLDDVATALTDAAAAGVDFATTDLIPDSWDEVRNMPDELKPVVEAFGQLREGIQSELTEAFTHGGATEATQWAADMRQGIIDEIHQLGLDADDEAAAVAAALEAAGLRDQDITYTIKVAGDELARSRVETIMTAVNDVPTDVILQVTTMLADDPTGALDYLIEYLESTGVQIPAELTTEQFDRDVADVEAEDHQVDFDGEAHVTNAKRALDDTGRDRDVDYLGDTPNAPAVDEDLNEVAREREAVIFVPKSDTLGQMEELLNAVARRRDVQFVSRADNAGGVSGLLDGVAKDRSADYWVILHQYWEAAQALNELERDRFADIFVRTHSVGAASSAVAAASNVTNVTLNMPRGTRVGDAVRDLDRHARRNGRPRATRRR